MVTIGFQSIFKYFFVVMGPMPNTGIPLPFVSYGLTSLLSLYLGNRLRVSNRVLEKKWKCLLQGDIVLILQ